MATCGKILFDKSFTRQSHNPKVPVQIRSNTVIGNFGRSKALFWNLLSKIYTSVQRWRQLHTLCVSCGSASSCSQASPLSFVGIAWLWTSLIPRLFHTRMRIGLHNFSVCVPERGSLGMRLMMNANRRVRMVGTMLCVSHVCQKWTMLFCPCGGWTRVLCFDSVVRLWLRRQWFVLREGDTLSSTCCWGKGSSMFLTTLKWVWGVEGS